MAETAGYNIDLPPAMIEGATAIADWTLVWPVALPLFGAAVLLMARKHPHTQAPLTLAVIAAVIASCVTLMLRIADTGPVAMTMGNWLPPFGISFTADMLSALFAVTSSVLALVVLLFAQSEIEPREVRYGFHQFLLLLLAGINGSFLTGDLFNLYVWFEVMLIASFGLLVIGGRKIQLDGAVKYGFLNFIGTTIFLMAVGLLYGTLGTLNMADIAVNASNADPTTLTAIAALFLLGFGIKAAAFPVNAWLPASYHTPDPAVSALFAGLLTKVGVYALIRVLVALLPAMRVELDMVITLLAIGTLLLAPLGALAETNLRRALGFVVIGGIGAMFAGIAMSGAASPGNTLAGEGGGIGGAAVYAVHSMMTMTAFYLTAGLVERMTGATDTRFMGGLYAVNAPVSILFIVLAFSASGLPPFLGFWPKLTLVRAGLDAAEYWIVAALLVNAFLTTIACARLWSHIFWRNGREADQSELPNDRLKPLPVRALRWGLAPTIVLVLAIVGLGLWPSALIEYGRLAGVGITAPDAYIEAVGLAGGAQ